MQAEPPPAPRWVMPPHEVSRSCAQFWELQGIPSRRARMAGADAPLDRTDLSYRN